MSEQAKKLNNAKAVEEARKAHQFRVLMMEQPWEAVWGWVQAWTKTILRLDMITKVAVDPAKPIVIALGWNYKGARAHLGAWWTPICKAVLDVLKCNFRVVLIDEHW
jgi:hypothetical protein